MKDFNELWANWEAKQEEKKLQREKLIERCQAFSHKLDLLEKVNAVVQLEIKDLEQEVETLKLVKAIVTPIKE